MGRHKMVFLSLLLQPPIYTVPISAASEPAAGTVLGSGVCDA